MRQNRRVVVVTRTLPFFPSSPQGCLCFVPLLWDLYTPARHQNQPPAFSMSSSIALSNHIFTVLFNALRTDASASHVQCSYYLLALPNGTFLSMFIIYFFVSVTLVQQHPGWFFLVPAGVLTYFHFLCLFFSPLIYVTVTRTRFRLFPCSLIFLSLPHQFFLDMDLPSVGIILLCWLHHRSAPLTSIPDE